MKRLKQILEIMNDIPFEERTPAVIKARHYITAEYDRLRKEEDFSRDMRNGFLPNWDFNVYIPDDYDFRGGNDHADET